MTQRDKLSKIPGNNHIMLDFCGGSAVKSPLPDAGDTGERDPLKKEMGLINLLPSEDNLWLQNTPMDMNQWT